MHSIINEILFGLLNVELYVVENPNRSYKQHIKKFLDYVPFELFQKMQESSQLTLIPNQE